MMSSLTLSRVPVSIVGGLFLLPERVSKSKQPDKDGRMSLLLGSRQRQNLSLFLRATHGRGDFTSFLYCLRIDVD